MNDKPKLLITAPKFNQDQLVTLRWNNQERITRVVRRLFDLDDSSGGSWWYKDLEDGFYPEGALEARD